MNLQYNHQFIIKDTKYVEAELVKCGTIWGAEANYMDPGTEHMAGHLQRALC